MGSRTDPSADAQLVPHVLRFWSDETYLAIDRQGSWCSGALDDAFVFPSFRLAQRYAVAFGLQSGDVFCAFLPVAVPARAPSVGVAGEPFVEACAGCGCTEVFACPERCHWRAPGLCSACAHGDEPTTWAVYERPRDFPAGFLARQYVGVVPTETHIKGQSLDEVRAKLPPGLACVSRATADARSVVEVWV